MVLISSHETPPGMGSAERRSDYTRKVKEMLREDRG